MILIFILGSALVTIVPFILLLLAFKALGIVSGIILFPIFLALLITLILIDLYATRTCIIEGKGVFDSLVAGWEMLKANLVQSLIVGLIGIGSTMVYVFGFVAVGLLLALPFIALGLINLFLGIFLGVVVGLIYIGVLSAIWGTYIDSLWTLAYLEMKKLQLEKANA